jgi:hypothetical protein
MIAQEKEDYLLGKKRIDKIAEERTKEEVIYDLNQIQAQFETATSSAYGIHANTAKDFQAKVRDDPLLIFKKQEQAALDAMLKNPLATNIVVHKKKSKKQKKEKRDRKEKVSSLSPSPERRSRKSKRERSRDRDSINNDRSRRSRSPEERQMHRRSYDDKNYHRKRFDSLESPRSPQSYRRQRISKVHSEREPQNEMTSNASKFDETESFLASLRHS